MESFENVISCKIKKEKVEEFKSSMGTDLFPLLDLTPEDVEFKYSHGERNVRVYVKGEFYGSITRLQWAKICEIEHNTIPQLNDDPSIPID